MAAAPPPPPPLLLLLLLCAAVTAAAAAAGPGPCPSHARACGAGTTPLDDYVAEPDGEYRRAPRLALLEELVFALALGCTPRPWPYCGLRGGLDRRRRQQSLLADQLLAAVYQGRRDGQQRRRPDRLAAMAAARRWRDTGEEEHGRLPGGAWRGAYLNLTSQRWLPAADASCSLWTHRLVVLKPETLDHTSSMLLLVAGGSNEADLALGPSDIMLLISAAVAVTTRSMAAVLYQVPNQPCIFSSDASGRPRYEDDIIAYTWRRFVNGPWRTKWPLRLPMTKATVRAMDALQEYTLSTTGLQVDNFVVAGASKRGWTAWTTAAVDKRVIGVVPMVCDILNFQLNIHHYYRSLGGWPYVFKPYFDLNLTADMGTQPFRQLVSFVDPYAYRNRLSMPKLIVVASNDEFFMMDNSQYYLADLPGENYLLILPDAEHSLVTRLPTLVTAVSSFYLNILESGTVRSAQHASLSSSKITSSSSLDTDIMPNFLGQNKKHLPLQDRRRRLADRQDSNKAVGKLDSAWPKFWWKADQQVGRITLITCKRPIRVTLWYAFTARDSDRRDFRWIIADDGNCNGSDEASESHFEYVAEMAAPTTGYVAFFIEVRFRGLRPFLPFISTTEAVILPQHFPFPNCYGQDCRGTLV
eukprot:SM000119S25641  [mRNA]  locus=s119:163756:167646:- [translate_table: standard]